MTRSGRSTWLQPANAALLVRAVLVVVRIRLGLWVLPWSRVAAIVGRPRNTRSRLDVARLERAVRLASRVVPFATCLTQALALNQLLSNNGHASTVLIGVRQDEGRFAAHAWVEWSGRTLLSSPAEVTQYSRFLTWPPRTT